MATLAEVLRQAGYVTPQGQVVGPRTTTAQTMSNYIRNIIPNAAQNLAQQRADIDAALTMGDQGIQVGDRAAFERQMAQVPNLMGLTAYHGTPHTIKGKFDISKVGTGEGAQAYGHGMYFAESPNVAETYRRTQINNAPELEKMALNSGVSPNAANTIAQWYHNTKDKTKLSDFFNLMNEKSPSKHINEFRQNVIKEQANIEKAWEKFNDKGNLYKVDIPDEYIPNMLDWDKPLSQQPEIVQKIAKERLNEIKSMGGNIPADPSGSWLYKAFQPQGKESGFGQEIASKRLHEAGILGIRYLDEGSRSSGKGTSNFVVFDPAEVKILEQNSKPMTRKEIIEQELEKVSK